MFRLTIGVAASSSASLAGSSSSSSGSTRTSAPASSPSSASSAGVHAACTGPRRPRTTISRIPEATIASMAAIRGVGRLELLAGERQHACDVERDVPVPDDRPRARPRGRTATPGSRGGRCTRRPARWPTTSREGPRRESRAAGPSGRRPRRRRRRTPVGAPRGRRSCRPRRSRGSGSRAAPRSARTRARPPSASGGRARRRAGRGPRASGSRSIMSTSIGRSASRR